MGTIVALLATFKYCNKSAYSCIVTFYLLIMEVYMVSAKMEEALNAQVNKEMYSAYLYMSMSAFAESMGYKGIATWFMVQYHEEMVHAMKIYEYIIRVGKKVVLNTIEQPPSQFDSVQDMFRNALKHEQYITESINNLVDLAISEKDHATKIFLDWYVTEQVEEEESVNDILQKLDLIGENGNALYMLNKEIGARTVNVALDYSRGVENGSQGGA